MEMPKDRAAHTLVQKTLLLSAIIGAVADTVIIEAGHTEDLTHSALTTLGIWLFARIRRARSRSKARYTAGVV
jgi:hypothetical protein